MAGMLATVNPPLNDGLAPLCARLSTGMEQSMGWTPADMPEPPEGHVYDPDLSDPATIGCLLALVREKHGDLSFHTHMVDGRWSAHGLRTADFTGATEAEALVSALEATP